MADKKQFNMKNPAVKRILQEVKEMQRDAAKEYVSMPLEEDIFEWQFAIHGPRDTEFEGGIYHGRIILPPEYPFKPPAFMLLTPSGRFEVQTKICLSISSYHPEHWQPSWSVRTALVALIAFMPSKPEGALGSLDYTKEERRGLAIQSRIAPPKFGSPERQKVINQLHEEMLQSAPPVPELKAAPQEGREDSFEAQSAVTQEQGEAPAPDFASSANEEPAISSPQLPESSGTSELRPESSAVTATESRPNEALLEEVKKSVNLPEAERSVHLGGVSGGDGEFSSAARGLNSQPLEGAGSKQRAASTSSSGLSMEGDPSRNLGGRSGVSVGAPVQRTAVRRAVQTRGGNAEEKGLTMLAMVLVVAIIAVLVRKFLKVYGEATMQEASSI